MPVGQGVPWTEEEDDDLWLMYQDDVPVIDAAKKLGRSANACYIRLTRLKITKSLNPSQIKPMKNGVWYGAGSKGQAVYKAVSAKFDKPQHSGPTSTAFLCTEV